MNDFEKYFPSKYLGSKDLVNGEAIVTIKSIGEEKIQDLRNKSIDIKPLLFFNEVGKPLILNKVNFKAMVEITGSESMNDWIECKVKLVVMNVNTPDGVKPGLRIVKS